MQTLEGLPPLTRVFLRLAALGAEVLAEHEAAQTAEAMQKTDDERPDLIQANLQQDAKHDHA